MNIKTVSFLLLWAQSTCFPVQSTAQSPRKINFALKAGPNLSYARPANSSQKNPLFLQFEAGISGSMNVSESLFFLAEISFCADKSAWEIPELISNNNVFQKNKWIKLPLLLNYTFTASPNKKVFVGTGPSFRHLVSAKYFYSDNSGAHELSVYHYMNNVALFGLIQMGLNCELSRNKKLMIGLSAERSLSTLVRNKSTSSSNYGYYYSNFILNTITLNLNYSLR